MCLIYLPMAVLALGDAIDGASKIALRRSIRETKYEPFGARVEAMTMAMAKHQGDVEARLYEAVRAVLVIEVIIVVQASQPPQP